MPKFNVILVRENYAEVPVTDRTSDRAAQAALKMEVEKCDIYEVGYWKVARVVELNKNKTHRK